MDDNELRIKQEADAYANSNKKRIAKEFTDIDKYTPEDDPVSVFMAGSPGAGKTESSKNFILNFPLDNILRIDPDDLRSYFEKYTGDNSYLFHGAVSTVAANIHDLALKNKQSFVFDGTFSNVDISRQNIQRSLKRDRYVQILYVYQDPVLAWDFVQKREKVDKRKILKAIFIKQYFLARETVNCLKQEFGKRTQVDLLVKNTNGSDLYYKENVDIIDNHVAEKYDKDTLNRLL